MRNKWDNETVYLTATIFVVVAWRVIGTVVALCSPAVTFIDTFTIEPGTGWHPLVWLPFENNVVEVIFASFFILWARRVKACACTKIITKLYGALAVVSLIQTLTGFNYTVYAVLFVALIAAMLGAEAYYGIKILKHERMVRRTIAGT